MQQYSGHNPYPQIGTAKKVCIHVLRTAIHDVRVMRTATSLSAAGFEVTIIDIACQAEKHELSGVRIHHIAASDTFSHSRFTSWSLFSTIRFFIHSTFRLFKEKADIYHACEITALPGCYLAAWIRRKPLIFEAYELPLHDYPLWAMNKVRRIIHTLMKCFLPLALAHCTAVITVSQPILEEMQACYHLPRIQLIRNLPMYQQVQPTRHISHYLNLSSDVHIALYQGNLQADRGLDILIRAAAFLQSNVIIVMMGQGVGATQHYLETLITAEGVEDYVKIIPPVPYADLLAWTSSADLGLTILPLDYTRNMSMALPNKLFEYIMAGLPILSSPLESIRQILTIYDVGQILPSMEPAAIGQAINTFIHDKTTLTRMHTNALQAAHQLCWERESPHLLQLYRTIIDQQK